MGVPTMTLEKGPWVEPLRGPSRDRSSFENELASTTSTEYLEPIIPTYRRVPSSWLDSFCCLVSYTRIIRNRGLLHDHEHLNPRSRWIFQCSRRKGHLTIYLPFCNLLQIRWNRYCSCLIRTKDGAAFPHLVWGVGEVVSEGYARRRKEAGIQAGLAHLDICLLVLFHPVLGWVSPK